MKTTCYVNRKELSTALADVSRFVPKRSPKPILQTVRVFLNGAVEITGTDMESAAVVSCVHADKIGADALFCVSPFPLAAAVKGIGDDDEIVKLSHDDNTLEIASKSGLTSLACAETDKGENACVEYPLVAGAESFEPTGSIGAGFIRDLLASTVYATETESSRYALGGILLEAKRANDNGAAYSPAQYRAIGTDGRRMAVYGNRDFVADVSAIIPARFCQQLAKLLKDAAQVSISSTLNDIRFEVFYNGDRMPVVAQTRLVEGRFPKWNEVIPRRCDSLECSIETARMIPILKEALAFSTEESRGLDFVWTAGELTVSNSVIDKGTFSRRYGATNCVFDLTISLDVRFVLQWCESLKAVKCSGFSCDFANGETAALFTSDDSRAVAVVMPLARDRR